MDRRLVIALLSASLLGPGSLARAEDSGGQSGFDVRLRPLFERYCLKCHGSDEARGDLDLEEAISLRPFVRKLDLWRNVRERLANRDMPPKRHRQPKDEERARLVEWIDSAIIQFDYSTIDDPGFEPVRRLTQNEFRNTVAALFGESVSVTAEFPSDLSGTSGFDNSANTLFLQPLLLERYIQVIDQVIETALPPRPETAAQKRARELIFVAEPNAEMTEVDAAGQILGAFAGRAWRRPVSAGERAELVDAFRRFRAQDADFDGSIKRVLNLVLVSPRFLLRVEAVEDTDEAYPVSHWDMASRLSYFLWASMPDAELCRLAREEKLQDPDVLGAQVDRMLADGRSLVLGTIFAAQWLGFQHVGTRVRLDPIENPWCTDTLMAAMRRESALFFHSLLAEDQPIQRLVDADYTFVNEELARHYGFEGVEGRRMRRVEITTPQRGGIFGNASVLAVTSFPHRTSPVVRGKWILSEVLGTPPPPPPPDAGELDREIRRKRGLTPRQKLELHREKPRCAGCHSQIDPLGFALEHYGRFGRWREDDDGRKIDATGRLPDGTELAGLPGLREAIIAKRLNDLTRQITRKMLSYALGRQLEYYDELAVRKIITAVKKDGYRFRRLIREIVTSYPFRYKKNRTRETAPVDREGDDP